MKDSYCPDKTFPGPRVSALNYLFFLAALLRLVLAKPVNTNPRDVMAVPCQKWGIQVFK